MGVVIKIGPGEIGLDEPIYAFNNSWYVRAPVVVGGRAKFRAWNNATLFCEPNAVAPGMCVADLSTEKICVQSAPGAVNPFANRFPVDLDRVPFVDCFAPSPGDETSHGISNHPDFPAKLAAGGYPVDGIHGDPGFANPTAGDFRLRPDSLARGKGCLVRHAPDLSLTCAASGVGPNPDIGAHQENHLVEGPDYLYRGDEAPRVMKATWSADDGKASLTIQFSTAIEDPSSPTRMAVRLDRDEIVRSEPCRRVGQMALTCRFATLRAAPPATATLLIARSVKSSGGKSVTLWASRLGRAELQP